MDTTREGKVKLEEEGGVNKNPPFQFLRYDHLSNFRFFAFKAKGISTFGYFILISFGYWSLEFPGEPYLDITISRTLVSLNVAKARCRPSGEIQNATGEPSTSSVNHHRWLIIIDLTRRSTDIRLFPSFSFSFLFFHRCFRFTLVNPVGYPVENDVRDAGVRYPSSVAATLEEHLIIDIVLVNVNQSVPRGRPFEQWYAIAIRDIRERSAVYVKKKKKEKKKKKKKKGERKKEREDKQFFYIHNIRIGVFFFIYIFGYYIRIYIYIYYLCVSGH